MIDTIINSVFMLRYDCLCGGLQNEEVLRQRNTKLEEDLRREQLKARKCTSKHDKAIKEIKELRSKLSSSKKQIAR